MKSRVIHWSRVAVGALTLIACVSVANAVVGASSHGRIATLEERIEGSQKVVVASARSIEPRWRENTYGDRVIVSRILLDVEETLKGAAGSNAIWLDLEGGTLDGFTLRVSDLPEMKPGERAVFFLDETDSGVASPHLRGQGILKLEKDDVVTGSSLRLDDIRNVSRTRR
jgi:hypothetical protein